MKNLLFFSFFAFLLVVVSCDSKVKDFENIVEVTPEDCEKWNLSEVHFIISYPDDEQLSVTKAQDGDYNLSYITFDCMTEDELCNEEFSVGYCENCAFLSEENQIALVKMLSDQIAEQLPNFDSESIEMENLWGAERPVAKFTFESDETIFDYFEAGKYKGIISMKTPESGNGVVFIMLGNENSGISDYEDFGKKGKLADIFKTFRFVE